MLAAAAALAGCNQQGDGDTSVSLYTVSGLVSGNTEAIQLSNNGGDIKTIPAGGGRFTFTAQNSGNTYLIAVIGPVSQDCTVLNGVGVMTASSTSVTVTCKGNPLTAWDSGLFDTGTWL